MFIKLWESILTFLKVGKKVYNLCLKLLLILKKKMIFFVTCYWEMGHEKDKKLNLQQKLLFNTCN